MKPCMHFSVVENYGDATVFDAAVIKYCMIKSTRKCEMCCFSHRNAFYKVAHEGCELMPSLNCSRNSSINACSAKIFLTLLQYDY